MDESLEGGAQFKALTQQLQRLGGVVAERVDAVLAARGRPLADPCSNDMEVSTNGGTPQWLVFT